MNPFFRVGFNFYSENEDIFKYALWLILTYDFQDTEVKEIHHSGLVPLHDKQPLFHVLCPAQPVKFPDAERFKNLITKNGNFFPFAKDVWI